MSVTKTPFVSVIVPVYNQGAQLQRCLAALAAQTYERSRFEIIVVDNGSEDADAIAAAVAPYSNARLTLEATPGSYAARNHGLTLAQGDILAFTDADCLPATDWLAEGVRQLTQHPNCGQVIGEIELFFCRLHKSDPCRTVRADYGVSSRTLASRTARWGHGQSVDLAHSDGSGWPV